MKYIFFFLSVIVLSPLAALAQSGDADSEGTSRFRLFARDWSPTFYSFATMETDKASDEGGRIGTYNYFSFHTYMSGPYRFSLRIPFTYGTAGTDRFNGSKANSQDLELEDIILEARNPELTYLPWDMGLYWAFRLYTPNSKHSKETGQIARFRNHFILSKVFTRHFEVQAEQRYNYYWQSRTAYKTSFTDELGFEQTEVAAANKQHMIQHWLTLWGNIKPGTGIGAQAITEDTFYLKSQVNAKDKAPQRFLSVGPTARFPVGEKLKFIFVYADKVDREQNLHELGQFRPKNTQYMLHSFVTF